jgi:cell division protein FtsL
MARNRNSTKKKYSRSEKVFYLLSLIIVISMVLSLIAVAITRSI